jgi:hypothetical protein
MGLFQPLMTWKVNVFSPDVWTLARFKTKIWHLRSMGTWPAHNLKFWCCMMLLCMHMHPSATKHGNGKSSINRESWKSLKRMCFPPKQAASHGLISRGYSKLVYFTGLTMGKWGLFRGYNIYSLFIENFIRWTYPGEGFWLFCFMNDSFCWSILLISIMNGITPWLRETGWLVGTWTAAEADK